MRSLSLALSPYFYYLEEDENFRRWVEALEERVPALSRSC
jgi:hypothetical protein